MEQLLGTDEVMGHPVWNLKTKNPKNEATVVPWHQGMLVCYSICFLQVYQYLTRFLVQPKELLLFQDCAYFSTDAYRTLIPTAWIPLIDANENKGCLQVNFALFTITLLSRFDISDIRMS